MALSFRSISANVGLQPCFIFCRSSPLITLTSNFFVTKPKMSVLRLNSKNMRCRIKASMAEIVTPKSRGKVQVLDSEEELAESLAKFTANLSDKISRDRGAFTVVLSGGSVIKCLRKLLEPPYLDSADWSKWHVFWVDERVVPKDHPDSNYLLAYNGFLSKVPVPPGNIHAINDSLTAEGAADDYNNRIKNLVKNKIIDQSESGGFPKFDVMIIGMGPDGHVASLFPGHRLVDEKEKWVTFIEDSPKPPPERITFTFPVINSSSNVALVVPGSSKATAVYSALSGVSDSEILPVQLVAPEGELTWFLDKEAASKL